MDVDGLMNLIWMFLREESGKVLKGFGGVS